MGAWRVPSLGGAHPGVAHRPSGSGVGAGPFAVGAGAGAGAIPSEYGCG